jgi:hypothetical protein
LLVGQIGQIILQQNLPLRMFLLLIPFILDLDSIEENHYQNGSNKIPVGHKT